MGGNMSLDNDEQVETVCILGNRNVKPDTRVKLSIDTEELQRVKNGEKRSKRSIYQK